MTFNLAIVDELRAKRDPPPPENFRFVDPIEVNVRTAAPKWTWIARVAHEIPIGKCVLIPVPQGYDINRFMNNCRSALTLARPTKYDKFSVRRSKLEDYVVIMKSGTWAKTYRLMEQSG